ncbi:MAG: PAS domain S-box protein, partial [Cyclobacteriaceae bacterium]
MTAIAQFLSSSKEMSNLLPFGYSIQEVIKEKGEKRLDWKVIENNQLFTEQLALKKTDTLGSKLFSKHELEKEYVECLSEAQTASTPVQRIFSLDNKRKWIQADFISNQVGQIVTFTKDISSTINEKLMYSDILSSISDAVFIVNEKGELQFICPNVATIFGFSSAEVQSMGNVSKVLGSPILKLIKQVTDREISNESLSILDKGKSKHDLLVNLKQVDLFGGSILITCRDVTDKVKFELAHNENSILLHTIIDTLSDLVWLKDSDGRYIMCNREFEKFFNVEEKDLVGKTDYDFVEKELADFFRKNDREVLKLNGPRMNEEELFYQDGSGKHIIAETIKSPFYDRDGSLTGVLGIARDITDRVRESSRFKGLFDQSPNGIMLLDTTGKIIDVNQKMVALLGGTRKQLIRKKSLDFTHEEDREISKQKIDDLVEGNNEGLSFTKRFLSVEGKEITAQVSISLMKDPFFDGGVAVLKQVQDISSIILLNKERDDFQLRYKRLLETSHDFIVIIDHTGKFVEANPAAIKLTGFEQSEFKKMHIWDIDNLLDQESTVEILKKIQSGEAYSIETSIKTKSGGSLDMEMVPSPIPLESQNWLLIIGKDITERKKKERQLEVAISDLERSQQIANIGSWHLDVKKDELTWSDGVYRIFGTEPRSFEGTLEAFYSFVHPEERD